MLCVLKSTTLPPHFLLFVGACVAQLGKLQADMEALREQRESTICSTRDELYSAQEEVTHYPSCSPLTPRNSS